MLKVDPVTRAIISHTPAPRKRMFEDFSDAARAAREADARRDSIFAQSVDAQKNKDDLMAKKFAEAVKKAKEKPITRPSLARLRPRLDAVAVRPPVVGVDIVFMHQGLPRC